MNANEQNNFNATDAINTDINLILDTLNINFSAQQVANPSTKKNVGTLKYQLKNPLPNMPIKTDVNTAHKAIQTMMDFFKLNIIIGLFYTNCNIIIVHFYQSGVYLDSVFCFAIFVNNFALI